MAHGWLKVAIMYHHLDLVANPRIPSLVPRTSPFATDGRRVTGNEFALRFVFDPAASISLLVFRFYPSIGFENRHEYY